MINFSIAPLKTKLLAFVTISPPWLSEDRRGRKTNKWSVSRSFVNSFAIVSSSHFWCPHSPKLCKEQWRKKGKIGQRCEQNFPIQTALSHRVFLFSVVPIHPAKTVQRAGEEEEEGRPTVRVVLPHLMPRPDSPSPPLVLPCFDSPFCTVSVSLYLLCIPK